MIEDVEQRATEQELESVTGVESGVPRTTIEAYAADHDIDVIVIGSTGASDVAEKLHGRWRSTSSTKLPRTCSSFVRMRD